MTRLPLPCALPALCGLLLLAGACDTSSGSSPNSGPREESGTSSGSKQESDDEVPEQRPIPAQPDDDWLKSSTVSLRSRIAVPSAGARLDASAIVAQLKRYDPGSLLRCEVQDDPNYRAVVDALGGVSWGYNVQFLEDKSQPELRLGPPVLYAAVSAPTSGANAGGGAPAPVEIAEADIVGLSESAALFYTPSHGLLLVDLAGAEPKFTCAVKLPGYVKDFYYYRDHLVALMGTSLIHFKVERNSLRFVESIKLNGDVLDTRRFNDKLVIYTRFAIGAAAAAASATRSAVSGAPLPVAPPVVQRQHRSVQVFKFGETLGEELNQSLINTTVDDTYLRSGAIAADTPVNTTVHTASSFGDVIWASDHYFVVTEMLDVTKLSAWITRNYQVCTSSHETTVSYRHCETRYETRPNPNYVPPDNSGGDRACKGVTLADCLRTVSRASNPTIQVPVSVECGDRSYKTWVCDAYENRSQTYPELRVESATRLTIFEYTDSGFVRLDGKVAEITTPGLADVQSNSTVPRLTTSSTTFDLSVPGRLQTLQFQNGFLYAIASGTLQVYAMGDSSLVRTASLKVANETLQSSLFSPDRLYLSDFGYARSGMDRSTLRVIDLSNPGFPKQVSQDLSLPGGHTSILATSAGILTIGAVNNFENTVRNALKLGLFVDPFTTEKAYLIIGTDLAGAYQGDKKSSYFDGSANRMFLPYTGPERGGAGEQRTRIGISHLLSDEIVSEGALSMVEAVQRVRPRPGSMNQLLSFGQNSIHWLTTSDAKWSAKPVLAYYTPFALYRHDDRDDYVELSRLGTRCQLRLVNVSKINARAAVGEESGFDCGVGFATAYGDHLLFTGDKGVRFDAEGKVTPLSADQIADLQAKLKERKICLFSETPTNEPINYDKLPPADMLKCYSPTEYQALLAKRPLSGGGLGGSSGVLAP